MTINSYEELLEFIKTVRATRIIYGMENSSKLVDYWSQIPVHERTFERLYEGLVNKLKERGIYILLPKDLITDRTKEKLVVATLPFEELKNTVKIMIHDEKYLDSIKGEIGQIIYLVGLLALDNQEEEALTLLELAEHTNLQTALMNNVADFDFVLKKSIELAATLTSIFLDDFEKAELNYTVNDYLNVVLNNRHFFETDLFKQMILFNPNRAELIRRLIEFSDKVGKVGVQNGNYTG